MFSRAKRRGTSGYVTIAASIALGVILAASYGGARVKAVTCTESGTLTSNQTWSSSCIHVVNDVVVPSGKTLTINSGTIVKVNGSVGINVQSGGTLSASGTSLSPITFTSYYNDSAGGDTNGDGSSTSPAAGDYTSAIVPDGGTVSVSHASFSYGSSDIGEDSGGANSGSDLTVTDSSFTNSDVGINQVDDNTISLQRNSFALATAGSGNWAIYANESDLSGIILSGTNANTFSGSGPNVAVAVQGEVPSGATWTVGSGPVLLLEASGGPAVYVYGTVDINSGALVKVNGSTGFNVQSGGTLNVSGSSGSPVVFTSSADDSVGGDSYGDGSTTGSAGDYTSAITIPDGATTATLSANHADFRYGSTALVLNAGEANVEDSSISHSVIGISALTKVVYRGSFSDISDKAITACNWGYEDTCSVDAAYVNWGSADGPLASNPDDNMVCGAVTISPWKYGSSTYTLADVYQDAYAVRNCDNSSTPGTQLSSAISGFQTAISGKDILCGDGDTPSCDAISTAYTCISDAMTVAQSTAPWTLPPASTTAEVSDFGGVFRGAASDWITSQEDVSVTGFSFSVASSLVNLSGTFISIANAYDSCAP